MAKASPRGKTGGDGFNPRERAFVRLRRADTVSSGWEILKKAGYKGSKPHLQVHYIAIMKRPDVSAAVYAPIKPGQEDRELTGDELKAEIRKRLTAILKSPGSTDSDKIKAADKLLATIPGGYVPVQVDMKNKMTIESIVRSMGGAPDEMQEHDSPPALSLVAQAGD